MRTGRRGRGIGLVVVGVIVIAEGVHGGEHPLVGGVAPGHGGVEGGLGVGHVIKLVVDVDETVDSVDEQVCPGDELAQSGRHLEV